MAPSAVLVSGDGTLTGLGREVSAFTPLPLPRGHAVIGVAAGQTVSALILDDGTLWTCGTNQYGLVSAMESSFPYA